MAQFTKSFTGTGQVISDYPEVLYTNPGNGANVTGSGTFSTTITENVNGSLSGSWTYKIAYDNPNYNNQYQSGKVTISMSGTLTGVLATPNIDRAIAGLWDITFKSTDSNVVSGTPAILGFASVPTPTYTLTGVNVEYHLSMIANVDGVPNGSKEDLWTQATLGNFSQSALPPVVSIDKYTGSVPENAGSITVTLARSGADLSGASIVTLSTEDGTAYAGTDYAAVNQQVVFAPGVRSVPVKLNIIRDDHTPESNKDFHLVLSSALNASLGFSSADINILESDKTDTIITSAFNYTLSPKGPNNLAFVNTSAAYSGIANFSGTGNGSANVITSGPGNDTLNGGGGNDTLTGGGGSDIFVFNTKLDGKNNVVTITDFVSGQDSLDLSKKIFSAYATVGADLTNDFVSGPGAVAHDKTDHFLYDTATGNLYYDIDGNGPKAPILFATLTGHPTLVASDLHIV